ncbi:MAG: aminotransferase class III-fold pyridoxal phosphate-dependent enzyme, partial [Acidimicrobiales bacterium]|nr:aminotransferase class III-fold pyridoxal phosphate-dependent enzyme [Acidimicrobiales bacterium]
EPLPGVDHVRGRGLLLGVELNEAGLGGRTAGEIARACLDRGLILNGVTPSALRLAPPFILTDAQVAEAIDIMTSVIAEGAP